MTPHRLVLAALLAAPGPGSAQTLTPPEARIRSAVGANYQDAVSLLERSVNIASGTFNLAGVKAVGRLYRQELDALGFTTRWVDLPAPLERAGHLVAEWQGPKFNQAGKRLLLIGHLDTVFEGEGQPFVRQDTVGRGAGTVDMKGGDVAIILALKALRQTGALDEMLNKIAAFYDDEVNTAVDTLTSVIEPIMIVVMGVMVGGMVVAMYMPMFKLVSVVAGGE